MIAIDGQTQLGPVFTKLNAADKADGYVIHFSVFFTEFCQIEIKLCNYMYYAIIDFQQQTFAKSEDAFSSIEKYAFRGKSLHVEETVADISILGSSAECRLLSSLSSDLLDVRAWVPCKIDQEVSLPFYVSFF